MLIKVPELNVPSDNPFEFDVLNRKENAQILTQLISTLDQPFVISIDSKWGSGKTTFIRMWKQYLEINKYTVVYFNAWENDISNDALAALVGEIKKAIKGAPDTSKSKEIFETVKNITTKLLKRSIPVAVKLGTAGLIDVSDFVEEAVSATTEKFIEDSIDDYEKRQEDIQIFKQQLENFAQSVNHDSARPLIFFIDELDRCRPNFAIEILEKAKHLFSVRNIVFIISIDRKQLGNSIKAIYGNDFDTNEYLRRFIDLNYLLPSPNVETYCNFLVERFHFKSFFEKRTNYGLRNDKDQFVKTAVMLFSLTSFSLRTIEQCFSQISIVLRTIPENHYMHPVFLIFLILMKNHNPDLYLKLTLKQCNEKDVISYLFSLDQTKILIEKELGILLEAYVAFSVSRYLHDRNDSDFIKINYCDSLNDVNITEDKKNRCNRIVHLISELEDKTEWHFLKSLLEKIDISQRFE